MATRKRHTTRPIDPERLKAEIAKRGLTAGVAGEKCGFNPSWISKFYQSKEIPEYAMYLLESVVGIPYDNYAPEAHEKQEQDICPHCNEDVNFIVDNDEGKFNLNVAICKNTRTIETTANFGSESIMSAVAHIHYCPFCGREL